jgi:hypothetical protein
MLKRENIQHGTRLRLLRPQHGVAFGTMGRVDIIREKNMATAWAFGLYWDDYRMKNRHSLFFTEADLEAFEIVTEETAEVVVKPLRRARYSSEQLDLPFTGWIMYRRE